MSSGPKIHIISVGKTKETWLEQALKEYLKRLQPWCSVTFRWLKDNNHLMKALEKEGRYLCLDPLGSLKTSEQFAAFFEKKLVEWRGSITFLIGGPEGLPQSVKQKNHLLSLSPLTLTHQMTRLVLVEQIYRAFTILKGIPYHK